MLNIFRWNIKQNAANLFLSEDRKIYTQTQKRNIEKLENVIKKFPDILQKPDNLYINTKKTLSHICVCTLALTAIPFATNKILEVTSKVNKANKKQTPQTKFEQVGIYKSPSFKQYNNMAKMRGTLCL